MLLEIERTGVYEPKQNAGLGSPGKTGGAALSPSPGKQTLTAQLPQLPRDATVRAATTDDAQNGEKNDSVYRGITKSVTVDDTLMVGDASNPKGTEVAKLKTTDVVIPLDLGVGKEFNKGNEGTDKAWWQVSVSSGPHVGKKGWVQIKYLGTTLQVTSAGKKEETKVGDGTVAVHTGQELHETDTGTDRHNAFALTYTGKDAAESQWLQFIWREIVGIDDKGASTPVKETVTTSGGTYDLTANGTYTTFGTPAKNNYNTDSPNKTDPFYEAAGLADRTADSAKMADIPAALVTQVKGAFTAGAKKVVSRAHFSTFLIKKQQQVAFKTAIDLAWGFDKKEDADTPPKGVHTVSGSSEANALPATIAERFHEQYPAFKTIK